MDLSNCKYLTETPIFNCIPNLERLDCTGCSNLLKVHPSIGHLTNLVFLSLQNCSSLVNLDFGSDSNLSSLRVLLLSGCTKLEKTPDFTGASNLAYLDIDGCTSLFKVHESIEALSKLRFLSLRDCTNLVGQPNSVNTMSSLEILDLSGCFKLTTLPLENISFGESLGKGYSAKFRLIFIDLSFCKLEQVPDAIGGLCWLERLNLQGNNFDSLPSSINNLIHLTYLNLAHCHKLQTFPQLTRMSKPPLSFYPQVTPQQGRYFKKRSGSRDYRSGLYIFDCPNIKFCKEQSLEYFGGHERSEWIRTLFAVCTLHMLPLYFSFS